MRRIVVVSILQKKMILITFRQVFMVSNGGPTIGIFIIIITYPPPIAKMVSNCKCYVAEN